MNVTEVNEVGATGSSANCKDKTVGRLPSKNLNRATDYLIFNARQAFTQLS